MTQRGLGAVVDVAPGAGRPRAREVPGPAYRLLSRAPVPAALLALAGVYLLGLSAVLFAPEGSRVAVWWPAAGLSVATLLLTPRRWRWVVVLGIALSSGLANLTAGRPVGAAVGFGLSNAAEAYVVVWWLSRGLRGRPALHSMEDLWRLLVATLVGNVVVGVGIGATVAFGLGGSYVDAAVTVIASHAAAVLVFAPLALAVPARHRDAHRYEAALQVLLLLLAVGLVFSPGQVLSLTFLPLPLLLWAALRLGLRTVSYELIVTGILTTSMTAAGGGPFALGERTGITSPATTASLVQAYLIVTALIALPLVVAVDQRRSALARVSQREELFRKSFSESFVGMMLLYRTPEGLRIRELNQTAAHILGGSTERLRDALLQPLVATRTSLADVAEQLRTGELAGWREEMWLAENPGRRIGLAISPLSASADELMFSAQTIDITDMHDAATRLRTEKDFTAAIINTTAALIVVVDVDGRIAGLNPAGQRASGYDEEDTLGQALWGTLLPPEDERRLRSVLDRTRPGSGTLTFEGDLVTTAGGRRRIAWSSAPLTDDAGRRTHVVLTGIDVTEERNVRTMTKGLLDSATGTAFIGLDLNGTITIFNTGARELLGYTAVEVTGRLRLEALHEPDELAKAAEAEGTPPGFATIAAGVDVEPRTRDWTYVRKDGSRVVCSVTMSPVRDAFGARTGYLAVGRDVTESRRSQRLLVETLEKERDAVERLQDLDRAKSDFVSMVSHELRTPITSIVGYTEMLQDGAAGAVSPEQGRLLDAVRRNGERLIALIEDLLTLSRIEAGTFTLERAPLDLRTVVARAHEALRPALSGRDVETRFDLPDVAVPVLGDQGQLERVVLNVVGNAVKFTEDGGRVRCSLSIADRMAQIEVSDTGIGIPEHELGSLFTRFFRSTAAQERAIQGTGLGLPIVQSIVHSHGGEITIRSRYLVGTEVHVVLPLLPALRTPEPVAQRSDA